ncbi:MAG: hypothetical protein ACI9WU_002649 [Myxococcota bacterium]|jgi:hypothetical protein
MPLLSRLVLGVLLISGCTNVKLELIPDPIFDKDDKLEVQGAFCTSSPQTLKFPLRVMFIVDASESMAVTDPPDPETGETGRQRAVREVWEGLLEEPAADVSVNIIRFSSGAKVQTQQGGGGGFTDDAENLAGATDALGFTDFSTNYRAALDVAREALREEMKRHDLESMARSRYVVIFLSDGIPDSGADETTQDILKDVESIMGLSDLFGVGDLRFHTAYISAGFTPAADQPAQDLLQAMAEAGSGSYRSFAGGEALDFLFVDFTILQRIFTLKTLAAINLMASPHCNEVIVDSDGDGLSDLDEAEIGTDPLLEDTDGDGLRDGIEAGLIEAGLDPLDPTDSGCYSTADCTPPNCTFADLDGDRLHNCEEVYVGTAHNGADTDADGIPDLFEARLGLGGSEPDDQGDLDFDSANNALEAFGGTDPLCDDSATRSARAYRYQITTDGITGEKNTCYAFEVSNITLASTLDAPAEGADFPGDGWNRILIFAGEVAFDAPGGSAAFRIGCVEARYRSGGDIKDPPSGRMALEEEDFVPAAEFDPELHCVRP